MKVGLVQRNPTIGAFDANVASLLDGVRAAADAGAELAICGELATTGYPPLDLLERTDFVDANLRARDELVAAVPIPTVFGFVDRDAAGVLYNAAGVASAGTLISVHHKSLLPTYDVFDEWRYFAPAEEVTVADIAGHKVGISICEDVWNDADFWPAPRYRRDPIAELAAAGAQLIVNISASPFTMAKRALRRRVLAAQAVKHRLPLVLTNQVGGNDELVFDGGSCAISATGEVCAWAKEMAEDVIVVDVDTASGAVTGPQRTRPPDTTAGDIAAAVDALILGTRDYVHKCGFKSALIGLSGGIDSAVTAAIAAAALGAENVYGVSMPSRYSSEHSKDDARDLAAALGVDYRAIPIEGPFKALLDALAPSFADRAPDVAEENLQARSRSVILMALSNKLGHMLLTTGNKSELAVGYCTLYGDMSGGLAVISDVLKTQVYEMAEEINRRAGSDVIPRSTIDKPPSAELRPDQLDQDSLPPYPVLDAILSDYIEGHRSRTQLQTQGYDSELVDKVLHMIRVNEYKRNQAAPGLKISGKAFGRGRRVPLASGWRG